MRSTMTFVGITSMIILLFACAESDSSGGGGGDDGGGGGGEVCGERIEATCPGSEEFVACGGDPGGTWVWESGCIAFTAQRDSSIEACSGVAIPTVLAVTGTITITASTQTSDLHLFEISSWVESPACLEDTAPWMSAEEACQAMTGYVENIETGEIAGYQDCTYCPDGCACQGTFEPTDQPPMTYPYSVEGNEMVYGATTREAFCVSGDRLQLLQRFPDGSDWVSYGVLRRVP